MVLVLVLGSCPLVGVTGKIISVDNDPAMLSVAKSCLQKLITKIRREQSGLIVAQSFLILNRTN